jgi:hypothetical protein
LNKLRLFYIYKFTSDRLKEYKYDINITIDEARRNGELVSIGDSQVLRIIREITNHKYSEDLVYRLQSAKKNFQKINTTKDNIKKLQNVREQLDNILHIPQYVSVVVKSKKDYEDIINKKFKINGVIFTRLMCGASHSRKNTVIFCAEDIEKQLKMVLQNGRRDIKIAHSKYNAYFALYSGATHIVSSPRVCVVPDKIVKREHLVDWVEEHKDGDTVEEKVVSLEFNLWDGMGIISPTYAQKWAEEMGIKDYIPSAFTIRNSFIKGMVCVFDVHDFVKYVAKRYNIINDVWSNPINDIRQYDMIITESQFKLWNAFDSWEQFEKKCNENHLYWNVARVTPKEDKNYTFTNYQFVQAIDLNNEQIKSLCQPTIDWIQDICGKDVQKSILFLSGNSIENTINDNILDINKIDNEITKALILNNNIINDPYIKDKIRFYIHKKIKDAYISKLLVGGNFQVMISDPYAFCEYLFNMEIKGLLNENEHYSNYWNNKGVDTVVAMRSPLTWRSEVNKLNLIDNDKTKEFYKYIQSGIVYNVHGLDTMLAADSDFDFDIVMTTDSKEFIDGCYGGLPITYKKKSIKKKDIVEEKLYLSDLYAFNSQIGMVTNYSTSMYCMLAQYKENSSEYNELIKRLKICRKEQGSQIDKAKGIVVKSFPKKWIKEQIILPNDSEEIIRKKKFENKLVIMKKPYFMRWLYSNLNKKYKKYINNAELYCSINFDCTLDELKSKENKIEKEQLYLEVYNKYLPVNDANCTLNKIAKYIEVTNFNLKNFISKSDNFDYKILMDKDYIVKEDNTYKNVLKVYHDFNTNKHLYASIVESENEGESELKDKYNDEENNKINEMYEYYSNQLYLICPNANHLANIAVDICYRKYPKSNKDFVWKLCNNGILNNIFTNRQDKIFIPIKDNEGDINYLHEFYSLKEVLPIEDIK